MPPVTSTPPTTPQPTPTPPVKSTEEKVIEWVVPINRSGWAIAAGYVALFNLPFAFLGPISVILGIIGLLDAKKKNKRGKGRALFAIIYGAIATAILIWIIVSVASQR
jgi:hypothetical protein